MQTLFGPSDSYYEHEDSVYCHFHYSTRFANKCAGCNTAILKQFVEVNRNMKEDCYHPECEWRIEVLVSYSPVLQVICAINSGSKLPFSIARLLTVTSTGM